MSFVSFCKGFCRPKGSVDSPWSVNFVKISVSWSEERLGSSLSFPIITLVNTHVIFEMSFENQDEISP